MTEFEVRQWNGLSAEQKQAALKLFDLIEGGKKKEFDPKHLEQGKLINFPYTGFAVLSDGKPISFLTAGAGKSLAIHCVASSGEKSAEFHQLSLKQLGKGRTPAEELLLTALHWGVTHGCETLAYTRLTDKGGRALALAVKRGVIDADNRIVAEKLPKLLEFHR